MSLTVVTRQHAPGVLSNEPSVDVVAVHGLYEGTLDTWTDPETGILWLRDLFPHEQLKTRVLVYGYRAESLVYPGEGTADRILPYATSLIAELCAERELSNAVDRPIIFVCHGLGGILVKRALALSSTSRARTIQHRRSIYLSTYGIIFMGTPHNGMTKSAILNTWKDRRSTGPSQFMLSLLKQSEMLREITDQFAPLMKHFCIYYFWEQMETWAENIKTYIVDEESAAPAWDIVDRCGIMATHSGMVKFKSRDGNGYQVVLGALVRYIRSAPAHIMSRWTNDQEILAEERRREAQELLQSERHLPRLASLHSNTIDINEMYIVHRCSSNYFTGRIMKAKILKDTFGPTHNHPTGHEHKVFVIFGLGGSGKTQFCLKYVEDNRSKYAKVHPVIQLRFCLHLYLLLTAHSSYWGVFWIDASSEENAESGFAYLGEQAGKGATFAAGIHWLSSCSRPWLLVLDNADDPDMDVSKYIPTGGKGHILITSRYPENVNYATIGQFYFRGLDPEEAIALLLKSAHVPDIPEDPNTQSRKLAQGIASELGYLALALTHAGTAIRRNIYTLEKYLHYYLGYRKEMISYSYVQNADDANIITTWEIPFRKIATRDSVEHRDAVDIMHIFAFMHFEAIPEAIFQRFWNGTNGTESLYIDQPDILQSKSAWDEEAYIRVRRAFRVLCDYSIIDHDASKGFCSLHPVVHAWARSRLSPSDQKRWLSRTAAVLAHCISPNLEASGRGFRRLLLPHIDSCLRSLNAIFPSFPKAVDDASMMDKFASVYAENGLWKHASAIQRKVVDLRTRKLGTRHKDTVHAKMNLGYIYWNLFEIEHAIKTQVEVLRSQWWSRPSLSNWAVWPPWKPDHISYCTALNDLTLTLWLAGKRDLSKKAGESAVKGFMKHFGPDDPLTLSALFNLARTYLHLGASERSQELLVSVVKKRKRFFGPDHPDTLMARNELGMCYRALGRLGIAEKLVTNVLQSRKRIMGEEHAYTLWSINDLAKVMCDRGRPEKAVLMLEEIIPVVIRTLGEDHVGMFMTRSNLARAYILCKRWSEAESLLRNVIAIIPTDHPDWIHAMSGYVHVRTNLGQLMETEKDCKKMLDIIVETKILTLGDPRTQAIAEVLLRIYIAQGRSDESLALSRMVPGISEHNDAPEDRFAILFRSQANDRKSQARNIVW